MIALLLLVLLGQVLPPPPPSPPGYPPAPVVTPQVSITARVTPVSPRPTAEWTQPAESLAEAQGFTYYYHLDAADRDKQGTHFEGVVCGNTVSPFLCHAKVAVTTPGAHTIALTATRVVNGVTSPPSPFSETVEFWVTTPGLPGAPQVPVLVPGAGPVVR